MDRQSKSRLIDAALTVVRTKGYNAARVDDICAAAGVTKGSFFHHFDSKDDLAMAAVERWREQADALLVAIDAEEHADPLDWLMAYLDLRKSLMTGDLPQWTCFSGTMIQEIYTTHPALRDACQGVTTEHVAALAVRIDDAVRRHGIAAGWTAESLALHIQAVVQGSFILAKGQGRADAARDCIDHLRRYVDLLFRRPQAS